MAWPWVRLESLEVGGKKSNQIPIKYVQLVQNDAQLG